MADVALRPGSIIDERFILKRQLGAGGCGAVWLAADRDATGRDPHDEQSGEIVLKILHAHFDKFSVGVRQLEREAELLAQLAHPNIAKPLAFSAKGQHTYLAMEYVEGRTLDQEIGAHTRVEQHFPRGELVRMFEELCSAIAHAHSRTIIHRDLKPQNVMISRRDSALFVKVLDFGIAKLLEGNLFDATTFGRRLGSMFYMSPEQCQGEPADVRSDIFSLGAVLFELVTLRRAWVWDTDQRPLRAFDGPVPADGANALSAVLLRVASADRPRPSLWRPGLPSRFDALITRAMAIDPSERFADVGALLAEFRLAADELEASPGSEKRGKGRDLAEDLATRTNTPSFTEKRSKGRDLAEDLATRTDTPSFTEDRAAATRGPHPVLEDRARGIRTSAEAATRVLGEPRDQAEARDDSEGGALEATLRRARVLDSAADGRGSDPGFSRHRPRGTQRGMDLVRVDSPLRALPSPVLEPARRGTDVRALAAAGGRANADLAETHLSGAVDGTVTDSSLTQLTDSAIEGSVPVSEGSDPTLASQLRAEPSEGKPPVAQTREIPRPNFPPRAPHPAQAEVEGEPSTSEDGAATAPSVAGLRARRRTSPWATSGLRDSRLVLLGAVGMVVAFCVGILLARWAAGTMQQRQGAALAGGDQSEQARLRYAHLDALLEDAKDQPTDTQRMIGLRDAILAAADELPEGEERNQLKRAATSSARAGDLQGMARCIERLRLSLRR